MMQITKKKSRNLTPRLIGSVIVFVIIVGLAYAYSQRNVYHVTIVPGNSASLTIEVPMQRMGRSKSFAKERGLPMRCKITRPDKPDDVRVVVVHTEHTVHKMRAKLRVSASSQAPKSKHKWRADFELDGQGDWPQATIVVKVQD
ncbi:MAG: hypothetical protein IH984_16935 [Planctomycetes bacterium]|nr:hypothetical protein [Planctomycetota bacterium]